MSKATVKYLLSEQGRKDSLLKGGNGKKIQELQVDATPEIIEMSTVDSQGNINLQIGCSGDHCSYSIIVDVELKENAFGEYRIEDTKKTVEFDSVQSIEELLKWNKERIENLKERREDFKAQMEELNWQYFMEKTKREEEKKKKDAEEKRLRKEKEEKREIEKANWIEQFGSDHLQRAFKLGHNSQRKYVIERCNMELPEFSVDFNDKITWQDRSFPSLEAIEQVEKLIKQGYKAEIVWLTHPDIDLELDEEWEKCEAILIRNYLGKYDLIKQM